MANLNANFTFTTAAGATETKDLLEPATTDANGTVTQGYAPFYNLYVVNTGTTDILIRINGALGYDVVPAGTIAGIENELISSFTVTNAGAVAAAFKVKLDKKDTLISLMRALLARP